MESIPYELLPMVCMTPACAASMRLVCARWSALPPPHRLFAFSYNHTGPISLRSPYYEILIGKTAAVVTHLRSGTLQSVAVSDHDPWGPNRMIYDCMVSGRTFPVHHTIGIEFTRARSRVYRFHAMGAECAWANDSIICECKSNKYVLMVDGDTMRRIDYKIAAHLIERCTGAAIYTQIDSVITCGLCPIHNEFIADIRYKIAKVMNMILCRN
jgi:hypothetical protein